MSYYILIPALLIVVVLIVLIDRLSSHLVKQFINKQGGKILECRLVDFRKSRKYPSKGDPVYQVRFLDKSGDEHNAYLHVNLFAGVYIEEDKIIKYSKAK